MTRLQLEFPIWNAWKSEILPRIIGVKHEESRSGFGTVFERVASQELMGFATMIFRTSENSELRFAGFRGLDDLYSEYDFWVEPE